MIRRGQVHWVDFGTPRGSEPGFRRPALVVSSDEFNESRIATVVVAVLTSNTRLAVMPGNVFVPAGSSGLSKDSVVNVTALATVDKDALEPTAAATLPESLMADVSRGLALVLALP